MRIIEAVKQFIYGSARVHDHSGRRALKSNASHRFRRDDTNLIAAVLPCKQIKHDVIPFTYSPM